MTEKFDRRRAIECKLVRPSKSYPGYYRYDILVGERDGSEYWAPAYGVDMSDALNRLLWTERTETIEKKISPKVMWFLMGLMGVIITIASIYSVHINTYLPILITLGVIVGLGSVYIFVKNWIEKN